MTTDDIDLQEVRILRLRPDDTVVFSLPANATAMEVDQFAKFARARFPDHQMLVLQEPITVKVIRPDEPTVTG